jgi:hypothetical protein
MPCARWKQDHIAGFQIEIAPPFPAKSHFHLPFGDAKDFMRVGMIMMVAIDSVAPLRRPIIAGEDMLDSHRRIAMQLNGLSVDQHRQIGIIWDFPIIGKMDGERFGTGGHGSQSRTISKVDIPAKPDARQRVPAR